MNMIGSAIKGIMIDREREKYLDEDQERLPPLKFKECVINTTLQSIKVFFPNMPADMRREIATEVAIAIDRAFERLRR